MRSQSQTENSHTGDHRKIGCGVDAHERVVAAMRDLDGVVVRATGFYSAYAALLPMARRGFLIDIGSGHTRTNPIDERDLAEIVAEELERANNVRGEGPREISVGGPEVVTRARRHAGRAR